MNISPVVFDFLSQLEKNNRREWFVENRSLYESALENISTFTNVLIEKISSFDKTVERETAKTSIFRIYRDIRFSPDKTPYKTHFGIYMALGGKSSQFSGYYLHIENNGSQLAGGVWCPDKQILSKIREEIYYEPETFLTILNNKKFVRTFEKLSDWDKLKRPPKGYSGDFEHIDLLKHKHYLVGKNVSNQEVLSDNFMNQCVEVFQTLYPFNRYMNAIIQL